MSRYYSYKIELFKFLGEGTFDETNSFVLKNAIDFSVRTGIGRVKDTFEFNLNNSNNQLFETFHDGDGSTKVFVWKHGVFPSNHPTKLSVFVNNVQTNDYSISGSSITFDTAPSLGSKNVKLKYSLIEYEDRVEISQKKNSSSYTNDDLLIAGIVNDLTGGSTSSGRNLNVSGVGLIEIFFNTLAFSKSYVNAGDRTGTVPDIIQTVISQVNSLNVNRTVDWNGNTTKSNGSSFEKITYYANYKRALDIIEELSSDRYTKDGQYYYYVRFNKSSGKYELFWQPKTGSVIQSNLTEGTEPYNIKFDLSDEDVVNAVIYNCGADPKGNGMEFLFLSSAGNTFNGGGGTKWLYMTDTSHIGDDILNEEFVNNSSDWDQTDDGFRQDTFPNYPYTASFDNRSEDPPYDETGGTVSVSDDNGFIDAVRLEAKGRGYALAKRITDLHNKARQTYKILLPFTTNTDFAIGSLIKLNTESFGGVDLSLRIMERSVEKGIMLLSVEEDETTLNE